MIRMWNSAFSVCKDGILWFQNFLRVLRSIGFPQYGSTYENRVNRNSVEGTDRWNHSARFLKFFSQISLLIFSDNDILTKAAFLTFADSKTQFCTNLELTLVDFLKFIISKEKNCYKNVKAFNKKLPLHHVN